MQSGSAKGSGQLTKIASSCLMLKIYVGVNHTHGWKSAAEVHYQMHRSWNTGGIGWGLM